MKKVEKRDNRKSRAYLTKRAIANAARRGFTEAARETMSVMGYNVIAQDGWVVKKNSEGNIIERISEIPNYHNHDKIFLD